MNKKLNPTIVELTSNPFKPIENKLQQCFENLKCSAKDSREKTSDDEMGETFLGYTGAIAKAIV